MRSSISFICALYILILVSAAAQGQPREDTSGIVKPQVTIIKPGGRGSTPMDAHGGDHSEHMPTATGGRGNAPVMEDYRLPVKYSTPYAITTDSKGMIWFTEMTNHSVARLDPATGELKEYRLPSTVGLPDPEWDYDPKSKLTTPQSYDVYSVGNPGALVVDKDGVVWFVTLLGNSVVRFDPVKEEFKEFILPTDHAQPYDLAIDAKGLVWFVEKNTGKFGYLDLAAEKKHEISLGAGADPMGIAIDENDKVWISDVTGNFLGRYDPDTKKLRMYPLSEPLSQPGQMRFDSKGNLWVCNLRSQQLGVLMFDRQNKTDPDNGIYAVVPLPGYNAVPQALAPDKEGRIWIVDSMTNQVGFYDSVNMKWSLFEIPTANAQPMGVTVDARGDVWFTQSDRHANKISRLKVSSIEEGHGHTPSGHKTQVESAAGGGGANMTMVVALTLLIIFVVGAGLYMIRKTKP